MVKPFKLTILHGIIFVFFGCANSVIEDKVDEGPSPPLTPLEEMATFQIDPGLKVQLVASEPMVQDPVVITFDEDGRLWVVEMRGFMPNIDGIGEDEPIGRVSVLEDTNGDGQMDKSTIFLDSLIMPRAIAVVAGGALVAENEALWFAEDIDGDLIADRKTLIDPDYAGGKLPEHSGNGLWRGIDNWYYNVKSKLRYKLVNGSWERDSTEFRGQWGISHDDKGRLYYNYNWSQLHADLVPPNYLTGNKNHTPTTGIDHGLTVDRRIYPIRPNPAVNRGYIPGTLDEEGKLMEFTAASAPLFFRGTALPNEYYGNVFVCEPSGNLIKRNVVRETGLSLSAFDPNPGREFFASTDERFRPVHLATGPDGALYIADMYRGLVQHGAYITPYLKEQTLQRKLVHPVNRGRIWRVVAEDWQPAKPKQLSRASSKELVGYLTHRNGWYRDMAQRLLVERNDLAVLPLLSGLAQDRKKSFGRFHALWVMEGMGKSDPDLLLNLLTDANALVRTAALRIVEPIAREDKAIKKRLEDKLTEEWGHAPLEQILQISFTGRILDERVSHNILAGIINKHGSNPLIRDAVLSSLENQEFKFLRHLVNSPEWEAYKPENEIFLEMLSSSVARKRNPQELAAFLKMLDVKKESFGWKEQAMLAGLTMQSGNYRNNPIELRSAPRIYSRSDIDLAKNRLNAIASMFSWPGHKAEDAAKDKQFVLNEEEQQQFALGRQYYLTSCAGCHGADGAGINRFAPPLANSEWVTGNERRLALIVLHGMEGPLEIGGKTYDAPEILPVMPAHTTMDDAKIASILTYIRNEWGNDAGAVSRRLVGKTRNSTQGRVVPWTAEELDPFVAKMEELEAEEERNARQAQEAKLIEESKKAAELDENSHEEVKNNQKEAKIK